MSPADLTLLSALLDRMTALPAPRRAAWVDALTPPEAALAPALRDLLAQPGLLDDETGAAGLHGGAPAPPWATPLQAAIAGTLVAAGDACDAAAGDVVGPYRLLRLLGRGGMGGVWLAARADGTLKREVALKLPLRGLARWRLDARFERERNILAALNHPNIAHLYDAGVAVNGQPYMALELVEGMPVTQHAQAAGLVPAARIGLFMQVLAAVQHAHTHLVVHRDLKPSNILVDAQGQVRLLDFGIATLIDDSAALALGAPRESATNALTEAGLAVLTPQYAAPEQILRQPVSTAADVYSLGVVLCELLGGSRPYRPERDTAAALEEAILNADPLPPSRAPTCPPHWRALLRGDLDNIVLKALRKAPAQRYASADAMAQDLQRHLDGVPVLAHPDSLRYRVRKFIARNRIAVGAAAAVVLAVVGGAGAAFWQARIARMEAAHAEREVRRAQAVQGFLVGLFDAADPARAQGRDVTARDLMARAEQELQARLAGEPESAAALRGALVDIYLKLGDEPHALPLAQARVEQLRTLFGAGSAEVGLALVALSRVQAGLGRNEAALVTLQEAQRTLAPHSLAYADAWLALPMRFASLLIDLRRPADARDLLTPLLARLAARYGAGAWPVIQAQANLAQCDALLGRSSEARALALQIEPVIDHVDAQHAVEAADVRANLGYALALGGEWPDAIRMLERAQAEFDRLLGPRNSPAIATGRSLVDTLEAAGLYRRAATVADANAQRSAMFYGAADGEAALDESFRVTALLMSGRTADAEAAALHSVQIIDAHPALTASEQRGLRRRFGLALLFNGKAAQASGVLDAVAAEERAANVADGRLGATLLALSGALRLQGRLDAAAQAAAESARLFGRIDQPVNRVLKAKALLAQAHALALAHEPAPAAERLAEALALLHTALPGDHPTVRLAGFTQAAVEQAAGRAVRAQAARVEVRASFERETGIALAAEPPVLP